ncbi:hypothetical protein AAG906_015300 [Vitis piasezkii]
MTSLSSPSPPLPPAFNRRPASAPETVRSKPSSSPSPTETTSAGRNRRTGVVKEKEREERERREEVALKIASKKAISVILRREATKAVIEKKRGPNNSKKLLPRTVLEALHERITALRWESALKVFELLREQLWYRPNSGIYIKLIVMLGKCKQPEKAHALFLSMIDEGCVVNHEAYTALLSAYSRSGLFDKAFSLLEKMKNTPDCQPDVHTYSVLIKSCLQVVAFDKVPVLLSDMANQGIKPNTVTYNTLIDAYGKAKDGIDTLGNASRRKCEPDVWTMNSTLRAFGSSGQIETMEKCYEKFQSAGIEPNIKTFNILLDSYGKAEKYEKMSAVMEYMQNTISHGQLAGDLKQMEYLFRLMRSERIKPSCVTLCSLVRAYGRAGKAEKLGCFAAGLLCRDERVLEMMKKKGCKPDKITYRTMIKAYKIGGMTSCAKELQGLMRMPDETRLEMGKPDFR